MNARVLQVSPRTSGVLLAYYDVLEACYIILTSLVIISRPIGELKQHTKLISDRLACEVGLRHLASERRRVFNLAPLADERGDN